MDPNVNGHPAMSGQAHLQEDTAGQWLSVKEAVVYCADRGLSRNEKTIRRWAERSIKRPESPEVQVREQDTGFGFRYMIEKNSLDLKIKQELEFAAERGDTVTSGHAPSDPDTPGAARHKVEPHIGAQTRPDMDGQAAPRPGAPTPVHDEAESRDEDEPRPDVPGQAPTEGDMPARKLQVRSVGDDFLMKQIEMKDQQLAVKDEQIRSMLERDKETNFLITLLHDLVHDVLALPKTEREHVWPRTSNDGPSAPGQYDPGRPTDAAQ